MAKTSSAAAHFLTDAIRRSGKTQKAIAKEVGLRRPNVISMMAVGQTKVPIRRIPALAKACGVPAVPFLRMALAEYHPELFAVLEDAPDAFLRANEVYWLDIYRSRYKRHKVKIDDATWLAVCFYLDKLLEKRRR